MIRHHVVWLALALASASAAAAQTRATGGDLRVIAVDESGRPMPGVRIAVGNLETGVERAALTEQDGHATVSALAVGGHTMRATADRFTPVTLNDIAIELGTATEVRITMRLASIAETIDVVAPVPLIDIGRSVVSMVISERQVSDLPIDRRNFIPLALLAPGAGVDRGMNQGPAETSGVSFAGQSARANNVTVDGLDNNDDATGGIRASFSQDAVREFQVLTHSYSAEFGNAAGGVVNIVTKSGANRVVSDSFAFYRNRGLNSRGYFDDFDPSGAAVTLPKAPYEQVQFGATLGGPVRRNRTFGFASFERLAVDDSAEVTIDDRTIVPHPFLPATLGTATSILRNAGFPVETGNVPFPVRMTTALVKVEHLVGDNTNLSVRVNVADGRNGNSQPFGGIVGQSRGGVLENRDYTVAGSLSMVRSRLMNDVRFQVARRNQVVRSLDPSCGGACVGPDDGGPAIEVVGTARIGRHNFTPQTRRNVRYQVLDTVSRELTRHLLKAGIELNVIDNREVSLPLNFGGQFFFVDMSPSLAAAFGLPGPVTSIQAFALGLPVAYVQGFGEPFVSDRFIDTSAFVQDEWRPTSTLTLRLGLRLQKQFWPGAYGSGDLTASPRAAVAWDPAGDGRTSIAVAYGLFFDTQFNAPFTAAEIVDGLNVRVATFQGAPAVQAWRSPGHRLPTEVLSSVPSLTIAVSPSFDAPYTHQSSVTLNRQLASDVTVSVSGIFTKGSRYVSSLDYNPLLPSLGPGRRPDDVNGVAGTSAPVLQYTPWGESWYRGLLVSATKRLSRGTQGLVSYTLSKAEDSVSDFIFNPAENQGRGRDPQDPGGLPVGFDPSRERGPSLQDQRHRLVVSGVQELRYGFQVAGIFSAGSGRPFNIIAGVDLNGDGDATVSPGPDRARTVPSDPTTSIGRNAGRLPREHRLDVRLTKRLKAGSRSTMSLTLDALNVFNVTNFTDINRVFGTRAYPSQPLPAYGQFTQAGPPRQLQIGARFSY